MSKRPEYGPDSNVNPLADDDDDNVEVNPEEDEDDCFDVEPPEEPTE